MRCTRVSSDPLNETSIPSPKIVPVLGDSAPVMNVTSVDFLAALSPGGCVGDRHDRTVLAHWSTETARVWYGRYRGDSLASLAPPLCHTLGYCGQHVRRNCFSTRSTTPWCCRPRWGDAVRTQVDRPPDGRSPPCACCGHCPLLRSAAKSTLVRQRTRRHS